MSSLSNDAPSVNVPSASEVAIPYPGPAALPLPAPDSRRSNWSRERFISLIESLFAHVQTITGIREPLSGLTHGIGAVLAAIGLILLIMEAIHPIRPWHLATFLVYGISMILLYTVSMLFHSLPLSSEGILKLRKLDHIMIFVFMAATYTPFCLIPFRGAFGWSLFSGIWALAALGTVFKLYWIHVSKALCLSLYFFAGLFELVGLEHILTTLQPGAIFWLIMGGISYCIGVVFYVLERPDEKHRLFGYHEVFHIFVMLGSSAHFWVMYRYIPAFD